MKPWYKGFQGNIVEVAQRNASQADCKKYKFEGIIEEKEDEDNILEIFELPVGVWTRNFKDSLEKLMENEDLGITDMKEYHKCDRIHF